MNNHSEHHHHMNHSSSGEIPAPLKQKQAVSPTYPVGSQAIMTTDHMHGMNGAVATISGAFDTIVYTVTYTPITGGEEEKDHKWVVHEEIKDAASKSYVAGAQVTLEADHMEGMDGAEATIDSAEQTTVYMVDYTSTDGEKVTYHKWVTESELEPVK